MKRTFGLIAAALGFCCAAQSALAHHSFGVEYDINKPVELSGVVSKIEWTNPHSHFYIDVKEAQGRVANWKFEGYPPTVLYRNGWRRDVTMKPGDTIIEPGEMDIRTSLRPAGYRISLVPGNGMIGFPPDQPFEMQFQAVRLKVPTRLLRPGRNAIRIRLVKRGPGEERPLSVRRVELVTRMTNHRDGTPGGR